MAADRQSPAPLPPQPQRTAPYALAAASVQQQKQEDLRLREGYFSLVSRAFDAMAPVYDATYEQAGGVMAALRRRSLAVLDRTLPQDGTVLEVGCGTGVEAAILARSGRRIIATDIAQTMLAQARRRAEAAGVADRIQLVPCAAHDLARLAELGPRWGLAGAYSSFGALNCEPELARVARGLALLLPSGAPLVLSVMNRWCLWELAWYLAHGQARRAVRRQARLRGERAGSPEQGPVTLGQLPVWYVTPRSLALAFRPWFSREWTAGLAVALPPPALDPWLARHPRLQRALTWLEDHLWDRRPFSSWGDHLLVVLRRTDVPVTGPDPSGRHP